MILQVKKETKRLREFEETLLRYYQRFLRLIVELIKTRGKKSANGISSTTKEKFSLFAVKCLCRLLVKHPHFNFIDVIVANLIPEVGSKNSDVRASLANISGYHMSLGISAKRKPCRSFLIERFNPIRFHTECR